MEKIQKLLKSHDPNDIRLALSLLKYDKKLLTDEIILIIYNSVPGNLVLEFFEYKEPPLKLPSEVDYKEYFFENFKKCILK